MIEPGLVLEGYEFVQAIGKGGYSSVHQVWSQRYDRMFVAKVTRVKDENVEHAWRAFDSEIQALLRLDHPNIIKLYAHFRHEDNFILILEHCPGGSLEDYMKQHGPIIGTRLARTVREVCSALNYAWAQGVQHRDIKPANIMFDENGKAKLVDFGISITRRKDSAAQVREFCCSRICAAPEIVKKIPHDPVKSDVWAMGVTIVWMARGAVPWSSGNYDDLLKMIQDGHYILSLRLDGVLTRMVQKMLEFDPKNREFPSDEKLSKLGVIMELPRPSKKVQPTLPCQAFRTPVRQRFLSTTNVEPMATKLDKKQSAALGSAAILMLPRLLPVGNRVMRGGGGVLPMGSPMRREGSSVLGHRVQIQPSSMPPHVSGMVAHGPGVTPIVE